MMVVGNNRLEKSIRVESGKYFAFTARIRSKSDKGSDKAEYIDCGEES